VDSFANRLLSMVFYLCGGKVMTIYAPFSAVSLLPEFVLELLTGVIVAQNHHHYDSGPVHSNQFGLFWFGHINDEDDWW
jgi:hypothetical protein